MRRRRTELQGLTLVELMVVLVVMGILVGSALPAMGNAIADRRVANVARDIVGLFNRARYMSVAYGRAHQVHYFNGSAGIGPQPWAFETIRGTGGACFVSSFASGGNVVGDFDCGDADHWRCVDRLYADDYDPTPADNDFVIVDGGPDQVFCYEGGVNNYLMNGGALAAGWVTAASRAARGFVVFRRLNNNDVGAARKVVIPFGSGAPRVLR